MKTDYIFFDCWDTLIKYQETSRDHSDGLAPYLINEHGNKANEEERARFASCREKVFRNFFSQNQIELPFPQLIKLALNFCGYSLDLPESMWEEAHTWYLNPEPIPGILEFLKFCQDNEIGTAVLSNTIYSYKRTRHYIEKTLNINFDDYFSFLLVSSEVGPKKPNPLFFESGVAKAGILDKSKVFYVGDSPLADAIGSFNAGLKPAFFNWKNNDIDRVDLIKGLFRFKDYKELQKFIETVDEYNPVADGILDLGVYHNEN